MTISFRLWCYFEDGGIIVAHSWVTSIYGIRVVLLFPETVWGTKDNKSHLLNRCLTIAFDGRLIIIVCVSAVCRANICFAQTTPLIYLHTNSWDWLGNWNVIWRVFHLKFYNKFRLWTSSRNFFTIISDTGMAFGICNLGKLYNKFQLWTTLRTIPTIFSNFGVYPGICNLGSLASQWFTFRLFSSAVMHTSHS